MKIDRSRYLRLGMGIVVSSLEINIPMFDIVIMWIPIKCWKIKFERLNEPLTEWKFSIGPVDLYKLGWGY